MIPPTKSIDLGFAVLEFREDFVVAFMAEDVVLEQKGLDKLLATCCQFYRGRKFVYISKRIHKYNVNPTIYFGLEKSTNLLGIAVVCNEFGKMKTANFEKTFARVPFEVFPEFEEALEWKDELLKNKKADL